MGVPGGAQTAWGGGRAEEGERSDQVWRIYYKEFHKFDHTLMAECRHFREMV